MKSVPKSKDRADLQTYRSYTSYIGKLGFKSEPAGKVRVFAMVECWTQWLLYPIHQFIFNLLDSLPTDGTLDQLRPINRLIKDLKLERF